MCTNTYTHRELAFFCGPLASLYENLQKAKHWGKKMDGTASTSRTSSFIHAKEWSLSQLSPLISLWLLLPKGKKEQPVTTPVSTTHSAFGLDIALSCLLSNGHLSWRSWTCCSPSVRKHWMCELEEMSFCLSYYLVH